MWTDKTRLKPFSPGQESTLVLPRQWGGAVKRVQPGLPGSVCEIEIPSRLHASVIDMNRFGPGKPGGGGIGVGVGLACRTRVTLTDSGDIRIKGNRPGVAAHLGAIYRRLTGFMGGIEIETNDHGHRHLGLGSSIATVTGVALALNETFGRPLALRDLRKLIAHNYCEEAPGDPAKLVKGFETNIGAMVGIHGGMIIGTDACELLYRVPLPDEMKALLVIPRTQEGRSSGEEEAQALLGEARRADKKDREKKAYKILIELMPAMIAGDFGAVGETIHQLAYLGSKRAEVMLHGRQGEEIYQAMTELRELGAEIVSMSSVGPAVFALSSKPKTWRAWNEWRQSADIAQSLEVPIDNTGARVKLDGVPIPYTMEPWWNKPDRHTISVRSARKKTQ